MLIYLLSSDPNCKDKKTKAHHGNALDWEVKKDANIPSGFDQAPQRKKYH
jgi:hypothetical protein